MSDSNNNPDEASGNLQKDNTTEKTESYGRLRDSKNEDWRDIHKYWREVFSDLLHWYSQADSKATGIIQLHGILLSFITLGAFLGQPGFEKFVQNPAIVYLLIFFLISVMSSVILALISLGASIKFTSSFSSLGG